MLLSAVSVLVVSQSSSEIPEGLMNNPVYCDNVNETEEGLVSLDCALMLVLCVWKSVM